MAVYSLTPNACVHWPTHFYLMRRIPMADAKMYEHFEDCDRCGGEGWCEADDPINDDVDAAGYAICRACNGRGYLSWKTPSPLDEQRSVP
jgi:hypothetical protein